MTREAVDESLRAMGPPRATGAAAGAGMRMVRHPLVMVALLFAVLPVVTRPVGIDVASEIALLALYAVAFNLLLGYTGIASFGHSLFFGIGAYGVGLIQLHVLDSSSVALALVAIGGAAAALLIGALIVKRRGVYFSLLTLAFTQMMFTIAFRWDVTGGESGLQGIRRFAISPFGIDIDIDTPAAFYVFTAIVSFAGIAALWMLIWTPFGKTLQGIRENEKRMRLLGCNTAAYKLAAMAVSGAFSALAGGLSGLLFHSAYAQIFDWKSAGTVLVMAVLGGSRYFLGPVLGALIYVFLQHFLSSLTEHWMIALGLIFILSIIFLPDGLASFYQSLKRRLGVQTSMVDVPYPAAAQGAVATSRAQPKQLVVDGISKRFGAVVVADRLSLNVRAGQLFAVIGPNGAGKTTLFNMISGLLPIDSGKVRLGDADIEARKDFDRARMGLSRSFQIISIFKGLSVFENVRLAVQTHQGLGSSPWRSARKLQGATDKTWSILERMGLSAKAHLMAAELSHGEQRLTEIAISIASDPAVLLLDEPLAGRADSERSRVAAMIRGLAPRHTVVLVEHDIDRVLAISDHVAVLHQGHLVASAQPAAIASDPEVLRIYLGEQQSGQAPERARTIEARQPLLAVEDLRAGYGGGQVLHGVSLEVGKGEIVGLLGRNGVGKTTTVMSIVGALQATGGRIVFGGQDISRQTSDLINRAGIGIVPQGRRSFPNLSVIENLRVAQIPGMRGRWTEERALELFPRLAERRHQKGRYLSGGEQQLLAIARALMGPLALLILDEPLEGLSPVMSSMVAEAVERLREEDLAVLLVEQTASVALRLVDRVYVMNNGLVVHQGDAAELISDPSKQQRLLSVHI
jgi:ABC-type branched-subunit amino acid transport system ATPase component/ABC-type branched-subunit amino acid transport system permease subunit